MDQLVQRIFHAKHFEKWIASGPVFNLLMLFPFRLRDLKHLILEALSERVGSQVTLRHVDQLIQEYSNPTTSCVHNCFGASNQSHKLLSLCSEEVNSSSFLLALSKSRLSTFTVQENRNKFVECLESLFNKLKKMQDSY
jgi:hypothetical protein